MGTPSQHMVSGAGGCGTPVPVEGGFGELLLNPPPIRPVLVQQVPVIRHRGSNTLNFDFHDPSPAEHARAAPRTPGTCPKPPWGTCPAPLGPSSCPTRCPATPRGVTTLPITSSPATDWYQTWPAKEAKAPGTPAPTQDPMQGPGAAAPPHPTPSCPRPPGWSATWTKDSKRRERRWVKYDGIGPVDETGMPIASRSVSRGRGAGLCHPLGTLPHRPRGVPAER